MDLSLYFSDIFQEHHGITKLNQIYSMQQRDNLLLIFFTFNFTFSGQLNCITHTYVYVYFLSISYPVVYLSRGCTYIQSQIVIRVTIWLQVTTSLIKLLLFNNYRRYRRSHLLPLRTILTTTSNYVNDSYTSRNADPSNDPQLS